MCWRRKERLEDDNSYGEDHSKSEGIGTAIGTDQEASPERLKSPQFRLLTRLKFWNRRKGIEGQKIVHEEGEEYEECEEEEEEKKVGYKCELTNNDIADDSAITERSPRDSFETIIL